MERRMLLAVVLSFLAVMSYSAITGRGCMAPPKPPVEEHLTDPDQDPPANGTDPKTPANGTAPKTPGDGEPSDGDEPALEPKDREVDLEAHPQALAPVERVVLESEELRVGFTSTGGAVEYIQLKNVREADGEHAFDLVLPHDPLMAVGVTDETGLMPEAAPGGADRRNMPAGPMRTLDWTTTQADGAVTFTFETPEGVTYTKRYALGQGKGRFDLRVTLSAKAADAEKKSVDLKFLAASGQIREQVEGAFAMPNGLIYRLSGSPDVSDIRIDGLPVRELQLKGLATDRLRLFGSRSPYFMSVYFAGAETEPAVRRFWATGEDASRREAMEERLKAFFATERKRPLESDPKLRARLLGGVRDMHHGWMVVRLPTTGKPVELDLYNGPVDRATIRDQQAYEPLRPVFTWPSAFDFIAEMLLWIYDLWRGLFGSAGLAVILMTLCVRGAMVPLSVRNQLSMRKYGRRVAKLKPKVAALQQRFANNPKRLREEQMKLYREHGVGFPTGCLMMLIQIPIFFALFSSLRVEYTIRGAEFLWIKDLSGPDKLIDFGTRIFDIGILYVESLNILPLLMVALSIIHTRNMPKPADEQQAQQMKMMKWLPIVFAVILYNYTAALALYMVLSSAVAIFESKLVRARDDEGGDPAPAAAGS